MPNRQEEGLSYKKIRIKVPSKLIVFKANNQEHIQRAIYLNPNKISFFKKFKMYVLSAMPSCIVKWKIL